MIPKRIEDDSRIEYYAENLDLPADKTAIMSALADPREVSGDTLIWPDYELGFDQEERLYRIKLLSPAYDVLGRNIHIGDPVDRFHEEYDTSDDGTGRFSGEYSPFNNTGVYIKCNTEKDVISSIEIFTVRLK